MDKTLTIERPAGLEMMRRDIQWSADTGGALFDYASATPSELREVIRVGVGVGGPTGLASAAKSYHVLYGATVAVDARVSRDLEVSAVTGTLEKLQWPHNSLELRFADPGLPAVLLAKVGPPDGLPSNENGVFFVIDCKDSSTHTLAMSERLWGEYLENQYDAAMSQRLRGDMPLTKEDEAVMRYMTTLAVKVLAYASVPSLAPVELKTRAERKEAGLHPKHTGAVKTCLAVRYLPRVASTQTSRLSAGDTTGAVRQFKGRAGCIRHYADERYVNVRGTWQWIAPIPPPEGIKVVYRVVKRATPGA